jgi:hypothetical protein
VDQSITYAITSDERKAIDDGLASIEEATTRLLDQVRRLRSEHAVDVSFLQEMTPRTGDAVVIAEDGSTPNLRHHISMVLRMRDDPMSSDEIAQALYVPSRRVSFDLFKRRVIVTVSAMHRKGEGVLSIQDDTIKGVRWTWSEHRIDETPTAPEGAVEKE